MRKNILMVGVLDVEGSTNIAMAEGFRSLGHSVEEYNYRTKLREFGFEGMHQDFDVIINTKKFDLIVFCKVNQMVPEFLDRAKVAGPTWYWFMDNFETCRQMNAAGYAASADYASATASNVAERFKSVNKKAHHIFEGFNPNVYYHEDLPKIHDFLFIGNATVPRIAALQKLTNNGHKVSVFGHGWPIGMMTNGSVYDDDERTEINSAKVVLNLCHDKTIFSDRVIKALACGANVISQNCTDIKTLACPLIPNPLYHKDIVNTQLDWIGIISDRKNLPDFKERSLTFNVDMDIEGYMFQHHSWPAVCAGMLEKVGINENTIRKS